MISAITALKPTKPKKAEEEEQEVEKESAAKEGTEEEDEEESGANAMPGVAFWVGLNCPSHVAKSLQASIIVKFQACGFSIYTCNVSILLLHSL